MILLIKPYLQVKIFICGLICFTLFLINSCSGNKAPVSADVKHGWTETVTQAERFTILKRDGYTEIMIINPWQGTDDHNIVYQIVKRGEKVPEGVDSATAIFVPLKRIICMSTTHLAMISALGEENSVYGMSGVRYIFSETLTRYVDSGQIEDVGYEGNLNKELIINLDPDLIMMYGIGSESAGYVGKIKELGLKVMFNADYLETDPLSKSEWIKLFGVLYCREAKADSIFQAEVEAYKSLKTEISNRITGRPKVMLGLPFKDTWYISPGNSFISRLISDAGGDYIWKNTVSSVSMPYGIENVYLGALKADFWLNIGTANNKAEISVADHRLTELPCFKSGKLYNNNKRIRENGGNDYWESGSLYPHLILKDIASILHPELFNEKELFFYKQIY